MKTSWKILILICFILWSAVLVQAGQDTAGKKEDKPDQIILKNLSKLNHAKVEELMKTVGKSMPRGFYDCLCRTGRGGAGMGVGVSYHPEPLEPYNEKYACHKAGLPCMAQGYGCWRFALPADRKIWEGCLKAGTYDDGLTVVDVIGNTLADMPFDAPGAVSPGTAGDTAALDRMTPDGKKLLEKLIGYKEHCLPSLPYEMADYIIVGDRSGEIVSKALEIAASSKNPCEEAVEVSLFLKAQDGLYASDMAFQMIKPWIPYNQVLDLHSPWKVAEDIILDEIAPDRISKLLNLKTNIELVNQELLKSQSNEHFRRARQLFTESRKWSEDDLDLYLRTHNREISGMDREIVRIRKKLVKDIEAAFPTEKEQAVLGGMFKPAGTKVPNPAPIWQNFFREREALVRRAEIEIGPLLRKRTGLEMQKGVLENHRRPLMRKGCTELLKNLKEKCGGGQ